MAQSTEPLAPLRSEDFLNLDAMLTDEERDVRERVRRFVAEQVLPYVADWYDQGTLPRELVPQLGELGLLGMDVEGCGPDASATAFGLACMELEAGDSGVRTLVSVHGSLTMNAIARFGSDEQKREWLPRMASGEALGCFALTEADVGSDASAMRSRAWRDGSDWILSGGKAWITNGSYADVALVWAQTDDGIQGFLLPAGTPGFSTHEIGRKLSLRASVTSDLAFDDVRLPDRARLPGTRSMRGVLACLYDSRFGVAWGAAGAARACLEAALAYAQERVQHGKPIASFQMQQERLVQMLVEVNRTALTALQLGRLREAGLLRAEQSALAKLANVNDALAVARAARQMLGANGITLTHPPMRHLTNLESVVTYQGTAENQTLLIGRALTGIEAFI